MNREFKQGSVFSAKVSGSFIEPPLEENILFYRDGHIRVAITPEMIKVNDDYYISASLPQTQNNFSMVLQNIKYSNGTKILDDDIKEEFSTTDSLAVFSASPGVIMTDKDFIITLQNLQSGKRTITSEISGLSDSFELQSGQVKKVTFDVDKIGPFILDYLELTSGDTSYLIPVYVFKNISAVEKEKSFEFDPPLINLTLPTNSSGKRIIYLNNTGEKSLEDISLIISNSLKGVINLSIEDISELDENSNIRIEVVFLPQSEEDNLQGHIAAREGNMYSYIPISVRFLDNFIPSENDIDPYANITPVDDKDDSGGGSWLKLFGWLLVVVVVVAGGWFFLKKYRGAGGGPINLLKFGSKK